MAPALALPMPKQKNSKPSPGTCTYTVAKIDDEVMPLVVAAAALTGYSTAQEYVSDRMNGVASADIGRPPINRRPPPARKRKD